MIFHTANAIRHELAKYIVGQDAAIASLASLFFLHCSRLHINAAGAAFYTPQSALMLGPTGSGKTYMAQVLSKCSGLPLLHVQCGNVSTPGYKGMDIHETLALKMHEQNVAVGGMAILLLDEIDKISTNLSSSFGDSGLTIQTTFLPLLEGDPCKSNTGRGYQARSDTSNFFVIAAGTFANHYKSTASSDDLVADAIAGGLIPELANRFDIAVPTEKIPVEKLFEILMEGPNSPLGMYKVIFKYAGEDLVLSDIEIGKIKEKLADGNVRQLKGLLFDVLKPRILSLNPRVFKYDEFIKLRDYYAPPKR